MLIDHVIENMVTFKSTTTFVEMNASLNPILSGMINFVTLDQPLSISVFNLFNKILWPVYVFTNFCNPSPESS